MRPKNSKTRNAKDKNTTNSYYRDFTDNVISIKDIIPVIIEDLKQKRNKYAKEQKNLYRKKPR